MRRLLALLFTLCAVFAMVVSPASPASAKRPLADTGALCTVDAGFPCITFTPHNGTGEDLYAVMGNQCDGSVCHNELQLNGSYDDVVIDRANECTNGATCSIIVDYRDAVFDSIQFRDGAFHYPLSIGQVTFLDSCDATSVCTKTPAPQPPITELDDGGVCIEGQGSTGPCFIGGTSTGTGQNLHMVLGNKCSVAVSCTLEFTLAGNFNNVVIDRANDCSNGAICTITLHNDAVINSLQINDGTFRSPFGITVRDRCDRTALCTKSP